MSAAVYTAEFSGQGRVYAFRVSPDSALMGASLGTCAASTPRRQPSSFS